MQLVDSLSALNTADSTAVTAFLEAAAAGANPPPDEVPSSPLHPSGSDAPAASNASRQQGAGSSAGNAEGDHTGGGAGGGSTADARSSDDWQALSVQP